MYFTTLKKYLIQSIQEQLPLMLIKKRSKKRDLKKEANEMWEKKKLKKEVKNMW